MIAISIPGEPVPFARAGSNKSRRYTPPKQSDFMAVVRLYASRAMAGRAPMDGPLCVKVRAVYLVPASWSQKRKDAARWKSSKPDADNIAKILKDAMNTIVFRDDAQVSDLRVQKMYGPVAGITITVSPLDGVSMLEVA